MLNKFKYSSLSFNGLNTNPQHKFSINHSMMIYRANALYSFIPKNACSTMRLSLAYENGCIDSIDDGNWIHANNSTFNATLGEAVRAEYTFTILRCPFRRVASMFLDKFVAKEPLAWAYRTRSNRVVDLDSLTFRDFVKSLTKPKALRADIHWRPQVDFLLYNNYQDYFCLENFSYAIKTLKDKIDLDVIDARRLTNHGLDRFEQLANKCFADTAAFDIAVMKRDKKSPTLESMYDEELYNIISKLYKDDLLLYKQKCNSELLLKLSDLIQKN